MQAATIKIFLAHGNPNGLRTAELSNWSGKAVAAPRTEISALLKREELASPGFYFLTGVDPESGDDALYIGEAENVGSRLKGHASKDFWNSVTVFVSKDENLTKAHIRYIEGALINRAISSSTTVLMNSANSGSRLPESDAAEMDVFLEKCLQLLPILGVKNFESPSENTKPEDDLLYCKIKGLTATGQRTANGFVVFAGSQAVLQHRPSSRTMKKKREELIEKAVLVPENGYLTFSKDVEFGSPSTAGGIVRGGNTNGLTSWKNSAGRKLKEIEEDET